MEETTNTVATPEEIKAKQHKRIVCTILFVDVVVGLCVAIEIILIAFKAFGK